MSIFLLTNIFFVYYNLVTKKLEDKEVEEYIDYSFDVPEYQRKKIVNGVTHFLKNGCENLSAQDEDLIYYLSNSIKCFINAFTGKPITL